MTKYLIIYRKRRSTNYTRFYRLVKRLEKQGFIKRRITGIETDSRIIAQQLLNEAKNHFEQVELVEINE